MKTRGTHRYKQQHTTSKDTPPTPSNSKRDGRPPIFTEEEKERLQKFVTRDRETRRMPYEDIIQALGYLRHFDVLCKVWDIINDIHEKSKYFKLEAVLNID